MPDWIEVKGEIHPTAVVADHALLGRGVRIGAYSVVGPGVELGDECQLDAHVVLQGPARFGKRNRFWPFACLGAVAQDRSYRDQLTTLDVGDDNVFREHVTVHRGTEKGGGVTRLGSRGWYLAGSHVAHDCQIGDEVTLSNQTSLGGHVVVGDRACLAGHVAVAQFVRIGELSFVAGGSMVERDVPSFLIAQGDRARVRGVNSVGLRRAGVHEDDVAALKRAYHRLWGSPAPLATALETVPRELAQNRWVARLVDELRQSCGATQHEPANARA